MWRDFLNTDYAAPVTFGVLYFTLFSTIKISHRTIPAAQFWLFFVSWLSVLPWLLHGAWGSRDATIVVVYVWLLTVVVVGAILRSAARRGRAIERQSRVAADTEIRRDLKKGQPE
jgi:hypothetical protein